MGMDVLDQSYARKLVKGVASGFDHAEDTSTSTQTIMTMYFKNGTTLSLAFPRPKDGEKGDNGLDGVSVQDVKIKSVTVGETEENRLICIMSDGSEIDAGKLPVGSGGTGTDDYEYLTNKPSINGVELAGDKSLSDLGISEYDDTDIKNDIQDLKDNKVDKVTGKSLISDSEIARLKNVSNYDDTYIRNAVDVLQNSKVDKETGKVLIEESEVERLKSITNYDDTEVRELITNVANGLMANAGYSSDYKTLDIISVGGTKKSIPLLPVIEHAKLEELSDIDVSDRGNGRVLIYDESSKSHKYAETTGTDEHVKMVAGGNASYLYDLVDQLTIQKDSNERLVVKSLDGLETSVTELNYIKGLQMPVQDLVELFANGGLKLIETPFPTKADLDSFDTSSLLEDLNYLCTVLADEEHNGGKTSYLIKSDRTITYYGSAESTRNFTTHPIDLVNEVTGLLGASNINTTELISIVPKNDTYKEKTDNNAFFGTWGANEMYKEINTSIGSKASESDLTTHTDDIDIHVTSMDKEEIAKVKDKLDASDYNPKEIIDDSTSSTEKVYSSKHIDEVLPFKLGKDADGNYGYYKEGESELTPFKSGADFESFAPTYEETETYYTNDLVLYNNNLYECLEDGVTGDFNSIKWKKVSIPDIQQNISSSLDLANRKKELLWTNSSLSNMDYLKVQLDLTEYVAVYIESIGETGGSDIYGNYLLKNNAGSSCYYGDTGSIYRHRICVFDDSSVTFGSAYQNGSAYSHLCIPYKIYGIK